MPWSPTSRKQKRGRTPSTVRLVCCYFCYSVIHCCVPCLAASALSKVTDAKLQSEADLIMRLRALEEEMSRQSSLAGFDLLRCNGASV